VIVFHVGLLLPNFINMNIYANIHFYRFKRIKLDLLSRWEVINAGISYQSNGHTAFSAQVEGRKEFQTSTDKLSKGFITSTNYSPLQEAATSYAATTMTTLRYKLYSGLYITL
jgi:hypothetical protein